MKEYLYEHIYQELLRKIQEGEYAYGEYFPSESQLCAEYDVSIITVRKALDQLKESGLITKVKGKGSMVAAKIRSSSFCNKTVAMLKIPFPFQLHAQHPPKEFPPDIYCNNNDWTNLMYSAMYQHMSPDYNVLFVSYEYDTILNAYETTILQNIERIVIVGHYTQELLDFLHEKGKLLLLYNCFDKDVDTCCVSCNDRKAFYHATDFLYSLGHSHIAAINGDISCSDNKERAMGYQDRIIQNGNIDIRYIKWGDMTFESGYYLASEVLSACPEVTAFVCVNDNVALGALYAVREHGLRCPEDISIIGHDNNKFVNKKIPDFLTTFDPHWEKIGVKFAEMLTRSIWIEDRNISESELVLRKSVAPPCRK